MALGRRCALGCESWPDEPVYHKCPNCGEKTTLFTNLTVLDAKEARSKLLHIQFEEYYRRRAVAAQVDGGGL